MVQIQAINMSVDFKIISHRCLIDGEDDSFENHPDHIEKHIELYPWMYFEIDVWMIKKDLFLGHNEPLYKVDFDFLKYKKFFLHAKNLDAFEFLHSNRSELGDIFFHSKDEITITTNGEIWCNKQIWVNGSILNQVNLETVNTILYRGICTDFPLLAQKTLANQNEKNWPFNIH